MDAEGYAGLVYTYNRYGYNNYDQSINSQSVQLSYGRRVTGRLAFQAAAGPQFASFHAAHPDAASTSPPSHWDPALLDSECGIDVPAQARGLRASYYHGRKRRIGRPGRFDYRFGDGHGVPADKPDG